MPKVSKNLTREQRTARRVARGAKLTADEELAARRAVHDALRDTAYLVEQCGVTLGVIETAHGLPHSLYPDALAIVGEYYNCLADEFDDNPDDAEPAQSLAAAHETVRRLAALARANPFPPEETFVDSPEPGTVDYARLHGDEPDSGCEEDAPT
jgi:hypothetical protein